MATFPALIPSSRLFTPGERFHTSHRSMGGRATQVRHSNVITGQTLALTFRALTEAQMLSIQGHYITQRGQFETFSLPAAVWTAATDQTAAGYSWRYADLPQVSEPACGFYDVTVTLQMEAEYAPPASTGDVVLVIPAGRVTVAALAPTLAGSVLLEAPAAAVTIQALAPVPFAGSVGLVEVPAAAVTVAGVAPIQNNVPVPAAAVTVAALAPAVTGGSPPAVPDPYMLLHMDGSNGSTTFTNNGTGAETLTANGNAQITTTGAKFGTGALLLDGTGDYLTLSARVTLANEFTIEGWVLFPGAVPTSGQQCMLANSLSNGNYQIILFDFDNDRIFGYFGSGSVLDSGAYLAASLTADIWHHIRLTRDASNTLYIFVDGDLKQTDSTTAQRSNSPIFEFVGSGLTGNVKYINGKLDEVAVWDGHCLSTGNFTPPAAPYADP